MVATRISLIFHIDNLARPERFELTAPRFEVLCSLAHSGSNGPNPAGLLRGPEHCLVSDGPLGPSRGCAGDTAILLSFQPLARVPELSDTEREIPAEYVPTADQRALVENAAAFRPPAVAPARRFEIGRHDCG
jgi:hypothetical protein